jgi:hypothetical protein
MERLARMLRVLIQHGAPLEARCKLALKDDCTAAVLAALGGLNSALVVLHGMQDMGATMIACASGCICTGQPACA